MRSTWIGKCFVFAGLLLIAAALCLTVYNVNEQSMAARSAADALQQMENKTAKPTDGPQETQALEIPDYLRDPNMEMPEQEINGEKYIGVISIPDLELSLPVISQWSYPRLKVAPCRYQGSAYLDNLILMAHNYATHFGSLGSLQLDAAVYFEDAAGNVFSYQVVEIETLDGNAVADMTSGDWDLTLFTCTVGGQSRVTVRCQRAKDQETP